MVSAVNCYSCDEWFKSLKIKDKESCLSKCVTGKTDMSTYLCTNQCEQLCKDFGKILEKEPNYYDLTDAEVALCQSNKFECISAYMLGYKAEQKCLTIYSSSGHNDESDACRHYMWSFFLIKEFGAKKTRQILLAHEDNPKQDLKEKEMDLHNNEIALKEFKSKKSLDIEADKVLIKFKQNLKNKKFIIIKPTYPNNGGVP